ncbi:MAG: hypothetical protein MKZ63_00320 [Nitrospinales bacterium]|nr:hypothetical protein [Nitrospinales bacterium]
MIIVQKVPACRSVTSLIVPVLLRRVGVVPELPEGAAFRERCARQHVPEIAD